MLPGAIGKLITLRARMSVSIIARRSGSVYGSGRSSTALTTLKIAVLAPMPRAIVRMAVTVNAGFLRSVRAAKERSLESMEGAGAGKGRRGCPSYSSDRSVPNPLASNTLGLQLPTQTVRVWDRRSISNSSSAWASIARSIADSHTAPMIAPPITSVGQCTPR